MTQPDDPGIFDDAEQIVEFSAWKMTAWIFGFFVLGTLAAALARIVVAMVF